MSSATRSSTSGRHSLNSRWVVRVEHDKLFGRGGDAGEHGLRVIQAEQGISATGDDHDRASDRSIAHGCQVGGEQVGQEGKGVGVRLSGSSRNCSAVQGSRHTRDRSG